MRRILFAAILTSAISGPALCAPGGAAAKAPAPMPVLAAEGQKNPLPGGGWFTWQFSQKPKLGNFVVKVQVFDKAGAKVHPYEVVGESGMPSMRAHDSGPVKFKLNKKGDYLLPVDVVMPGEWRVVIRVKKDKKEIYAGQVLFSI